MFWLIFLLFLSFFLVLYTYFGYPLSLVILSRYKKNIFDKRSFTPTVSFIIAAHNEEKRIKRKIENSLKLNYPNKKLQIIIASDGSTDKTNQIVERYQQQYKSINLLNKKERKGKENVQQQAVLCAKGDIIVFSDVATIIEPDGLLHLVSNFSNTKIGCVSSEDRIFDKNG